MPDRVRAILMVVGGGLFALGGLYVMARGNLLIGGVVVLFFGAVTLVGAAMLGDWTAWALGIACIAVALALGIIAWSLLTDDESPFHSGRWAPAVATPVCAVGAVLFALAGIGLLARLIMTRRAGRPRPAPHPPR